jgi:hypothetical protein
VRIRCAVDSESSSFAGLYEDFIEKVLLLRNAWPTRYPLLHIVYRHVAAAQEHLQQASVLTFSRAIRHAASQPR